MELYNISDLSNIIYCRCHYRLCSSCIHLDVIKLSSLNGEGCGQQAMWEKIKPEQHSEKMCQIYTILYVCTCMYVNTCIK